MYTKCGNCANSKTDLCNSCEWKLDKKDNYKKAKRYRSAAKITAELLHKLLNLREDIVIGHIGFEDIYNDIVRIGITSKEEVIGITFDHHEGTPIENIDFNKLTKPSSAKKENPRNFYKDDFISAKAREKDNIFRNYICICADDKVAVFAPYVRYEDHLHTIYENLIAYPNDSNHKPDSKCVTLVCRPR